MRLFFPPFIFSFLSSISLSRSLYLFARPSRRRGEVTNLAAIPARDISARLRLLINKQYCCEIGLMTK